MLKIAAQQFNLKDYEILRNLRINLAYSHKYGMFFVLLGVYNLGSAALSGMKYEYRELIRALTWQMP